MTGTDEPFKYKAMAAQIVSAEGMGNLLPVVEKELLHYRILDAMMREGFFSSLVFQGGTSLRLCHGPRGTARTLILPAAPRSTWTPLKGLAPASPIRSRGWAMM